MLAQRFTLDVTTDSSGDATVYAPPAGSGTVDGRFLSIHYVKDGSNAFSDGVDMTVTAEATGEALVTVSNMNASADYYPRQQVCDVAGSGLTYDGTNKVSEPVTLADDRVKIVIASGGSTKNGRLHVVIG